MNYQNNNMTMNNTNMNYQNNNMMMNPMLHDDSNGMMNMNNLGYSEVKNERKEEEKMKERDIKRKREETMEIIKTQDFINGFWELNEKTKIVKEKYKKEYDLLKDKNYNDRVAITILIIYFINKENYELLNELIMIIEKAKLFIKNEINNSYENIINEIGFN